MGVRKFRVEEKKQRYEYMRERYRRLTSTDDLCDLFFAPQTFRGDVGLPPRAAPSSATPLIGVDIDVVSVVL